MLNSYMLRHLPVAVPETLPPTLLVVVDTEEEFDWNAPFSRMNTSVRAMRRIGAAHLVFDRYGVRPTYMVDYPVASQTEGVAPLRDLFDSGRCAIGAHLHPWVTPPHVEAVGPETSFTCNLPATVQAAKLRILTDTIEESFGCRPRMFKAGRYGLGPDTVAALDELGYEVDTSVLPHMDFRGIGGPSFDGFEPTPFFLSPAIVEFPCTVGYVGWLGRLAKPAHTLASHPLLAPVMVPALGRSRGVNRVMLSPEGNTLAMRDLTLELYAQGLRIFTLSYHSPSLDAGHTPYVRSSKDVDRFLAVLDGYCEFFMGDLRGTSSTPRDLRSRLVSEQPR
jgi:hypothetical protein